MLGLAGMGVASAQYDYSSAARLDSIENALSSANSRLAELRADSIHESVWRSGRYFNLGYSIASTAGEVYEAEKAKFGIFLNKGTSYLWPRKKPVGGVVKFGLDARWIDLQFAMYDKFARPVYSSGSGYTNNYQGWTSNMQQPSSSTSTSDPNYLRFSHMSALVGLCGVGPTITVAPLSFMDNEAASLRLNVYFHYQPTFGVNFYSWNLVNAASASAAVDAQKWGDGSHVEIEIGYINMMDFGFKLQWRIFGLGVEGRWGSGKMNNSTLDPYGYNNGTSFYGQGVSMNKREDTDGSYTRKFAETRIYVDFVF